MAVQGVLAKKKDFIKLMPKCIRKRVRRYLLKRDRNDHNVYKYFRKFETEGGHRQPSDFVDRVINRIRGR